jgi:long-chain fatty acid transport protein
MNIKRTLLATLISTAIAPATVLATDGYFSHGYGMKAKGMAGVSTARTDDTFGGANNPAQGVFVGDRLDAGADWFSPVRSAERSGAAIPPLNGKVDSGRENFLIPEFGYNKMISPVMSLGVSVYGNGGMNTAYPQGSFQCPTPTGSMAPGNALCGGGKLGVDLSQLIIAPTFSYKIAPSHAIGIAPLFGYQRFKMEGVQLFAMFSASPSNVSNNDYASSTGYGARVGYLGKLSDSVSIGAAYSTKMKMGKFDKYKGLFADDGGFDMPENYNVGVMIRATPELSFGLDFKRINYSGVNSVGNPSTNIFQAPLGASNGPGFGWQDVDVIKLGVQYAVNSALTVRAGYGKSDNPILARDVTFNILAPGVVQDHYTLGLTYALDRNSEITMAYMHAAKQSVTGTSLMTPLFMSMGGPANAAGTETIQMSQNSLGIAWGAKF